MSTSICLRTLLPAEHILLLPTCQSKKRAFEQATLLLENVSGMPRDELFSLFMQREQKNSTSIGFFGAIPHLHMNVKEPLCVLTRLQQPIQYDADNAPTSLVHTLFFLIVPEKASKMHLKLLSIFSHILADENCMAQIADCVDAAAIHKVIADWEVAQHSVLEAIWTVE
ncbi:MAG: PTS sugar transporter subunit IIA [Proteobacteria bacterium]|nr:PTS sugar transporter subunit IIA [Pseudomonadota bacterium]MCH9757544.1 PTS sugar transporter subunit IIA [Pseudomonadota bacterium]